MSLLGVADEDELKTLIGSKSYWDERHPDHARVNQIVAQGFRRLYPDAKNAKVGGGRLGDEAKKESSRRSRLA